MTNRVEPTTEVPSAPKESSPFLDLLKSHVNSKLCYNSSALDKAKVGKVDKSQVAYQIDLWTLVETRELKRLQKPYQNEPVPGQPVQQAWSYDFRSPATVLSGKKKEVHNLLDTHTVTVCSECNGVGRHTCPSCQGACAKPCTNCSMEVLPNTDKILYRKTCSFCKGSALEQCTTCDTIGYVNCKRCDKRGKIRHWYELTIQRYTIHSVSFQSNSQLPPKIIKKSTGKEVYWSNDQEWSKTTPLLEHLKKQLPDQQASFPVKAQEIVEDYDKKHLKNIKENCEISRIKCEVRKLSIAEVEYELDGYVNKKYQNMGKICDRLIKTIMNFLLSLGNKFKFYHYGTEKKDKPLIYEDDYPLNACGCCGGRCAHYSKCCTIS